MTHNHWWASLVGVSVLAWGTIGVVRPNVHHDETPPPTPDAPADDSGVPSLATRAEAGQAEERKTTRALDTEKAEFCPADMVEIQGEYCQAVEQYCKEYLSERRDRCAVYSDKVRCRGKSRQMHFCVDRYEYPNRAGEKPTRAVMFTEAAQLCAAEGKRLCTADEWTQACEGPKHLPYPYGFVRNSDACNHDKTYIMPDNDAYMNPATRAAEVARVDQSEPSGSRSACVSDYGVFDMTGNVDEWVKNEAGSFSGPPYESGLKGGYWGPVRNRCRPMTTDHNRWHSGYQIGLRCCRNPVGSSSTPKAPNAEDALRPGAPTSEAARDLSRS